MWIIFNYNSIIKIFEIFDSALPLVNLESH